MNKTVHLARVMAEGGRDGRVSTDLNSLDLHLSSAHTIAALTPEHLFGAAYAACFLGAMKHAAERQHLHVPGLTVEARVALKEDEHEAWFLHIRLVATVPGMDEHRARHLMHLAHQTSPYSQALRGNVTVELGSD